MPTTTQKTLPSHVIKWEVREYSRDNVTLLTGSLYVAGQVLGRITATGKYKEFDPALSDGSQNAAAICADAYDATGGDVKGTANTRLSIVARQALTWKAGVTAPQQTAALAALTTLGIVNREAA